MRKLLTAALLSLAMGAGSAYAADIVVKVRPPNAVVEHRDRAPEQGSRVGIGIPPLGRPRLCLGAWPLGTAASAARKMGSPEMGAPA